MYLMKVSAFAAFVVTCLSAITSSGDRLAGDCERPSVTACPPATPEPADTPHEYAERQSLSDSATSAIAAPKMYKVTLSATQPTYSDLSAKI
jgi:hypothetical protein